MFRNSRITVISAHPDDFEIGMGQFLLELLDPERDNRIEICVVTDGGAGGTLRVRQQEQAAVETNLRARFPRTFVGIHPKSYAFPDTELFPSKALITYLEEVCRDSDIVFTHFPDDTHQDHRALGICIQPACRFVRNVIFYQSYSVRNFQPTMFFDFTEAEMIADTGKLGLISFHTSQVERYQGSNQDLHEDMHALAAYNGFLFKTPKRYAEGFVPWKIALESPPSRGTAAE